MSFDIYIVKHCGECSDPMCTEGRKVYSVNITHNVNDIVDQCFSMGGMPAESLININSYHQRSWGRLEGYACLDVLRFLRAALAAANDPGNREMFVKMEPDNKWGTLESVQRVIGEVCKAAAENPNGRFNTSG